ncbi:hypothetical protein WMY93_005671 [Mugilogobius chulae]|uniref:Perforin-1-like n=1 Tax=Mugilogobius chulae TaxID=88201 RepID=A0AAW0PTR8_9GOBI
MSPNGTCRLFKNPLQGNQLQKLPLAAVDFRAFTSCQAAVFQSAESSVSKVVSAMTNQDSSDWQIGLDVEGYGDLEVGGTRSDAFNFALARANEDKFTFSIHRSSCRYYRYRVSNTPPLSSEFLNDVSLLPASYDSSTKAQYRLLINTYGTHFIRQASLGGRFRRLTAVRTCLVSLNGFSSTQAHSCLSMGIKVGLGKYAANGSYNSCKNLLQNQGVATSFSTGMHLHQTQVVGGQGWDGEFSLLFNDSQGYNNWLQSLKDLPDIVEYSLRLMSDLVPDSQKRENMKAAIEDYLKENGISWSGLLTVTIVRAWGLKGDWAGKTESYVKMWYGSHYHRTPVIKSNNPTWNAHYNLGMVDTHASLKIEVWDKDWGRDDLLGSCTRHPNQGTHTFSCYAKEGGVEVRYTLTCAPHLTGSHCDEYKPTP